VQVKHFRTLRAFGAAKSTTSRVHCAMMRQFDPTRSWFAHDLRARTRLEPVATANDV
jgi:hypothetical protein